MISLLITDPLYLIKETVPQKMMILQHIVCCIHHPDSQCIFHLLKDNCRLCCESLIVSGKYLLDLEMSMGINRTPVD
jgi:hypothetical protein